MNGRQLAMNRKPAAELVRVPEREVARLPAGRDARRFGACRLGPIGFLALAWPLMLLASISGCSLLRGPVQRPPLATGSSAPVQIHADFEIDHSHPLFREPERLLAAMEQTLAMPSPSRAIHVYLFETEESYRTYLNRRYPQFDNRQAYFVHDGPELAVYAYFSDAVDVDLRHELTHAYLHAGFTSIPLWLDEGLAEYFEVDDNGQGLNALHVAHLTAERRAGKWIPNLGRLENIRDLNKMTQLDYAESWCWVHWMLHSSPERKRMLIDYLTMVGTNKTGKALAPMVYATTPMADTELLAHLRRLGELH